MEFFDSICIWRPVGVDPIGISARSFVTKNYRIFMLPCSVDCMTIGSIVFTALLLYASTIYAMAILSVSVCHNPEFAKEINVAR